jgi:hypothetical protein
VTYHLSLLLAAAARMIATQTTLEDSSGMGAGRPGVNGLGQEAGAHPDDPDYGDIGQAFPAWRRPARGAILQPPEPEIPPSPQILQHVMDYDPDWEAAD